MKDFTFTNGTFVPAGTMICVSGFSTHHNEVRLVFQLHDIHWQRHHKVVYYNPEQFDGLRFFRMREAEGEAVKYQAASLGLDYVPFGTGRHAWSVLYHVAVSAR
jgi:hypothetical protein